MVCRTFSLPLQIIMLLSHGADASIVDADGKLPLHHAGLSGDRTCYDTLYNAFPSAAALADLKVMSFNNACVLPSRAVASAFSCTRLQVYTARRAPIQGQLPTLSQSAG